MIEDDFISSRSSDKGMVLPSIVGKIEFCEVSFTYPSRPTIVFEDLNFTVSAGKSLAVVGPSGSGKSTIISMILRFYNPTSGTLRDIIYLILLVVSKSSRINCVIYQVRFCWMGMI